MNTIEQENTILRLESQYAVLLDKCDRLTAERDEAREMYCRSWIGRFPQDFRGMDETTAMVHAMKLLFRVPNYNYKVVGTDARD